MSNRQIEAYIQELELYYSLFTATKDTLGNAQEERPRNDANIRRLIADLSETRNDIQRVITRINQLNIPGIRIQNINNNLSLSETPIYDLFPTLLEDIARIKAILQGNSAAAVRPNNAATAIRPNNDAMAAAAFIPNNAAIEAAAFRQNNAAMAPAAFIPNNAAIEAASLRPKNTNMTIAIHQFFYGDLTEEQQMEIFRRMEQEEAEAARAAPAASATQRNNYYNKYLKYKAKYLALKKQYI
jgi:hypothetical protein